MKHLEKILDKNARETMLQWNIESFKETHPRLFKSIISAMSEVEKSNSDRIEELSNGVRTGIEAIQELHEFQDGWSEDEDRLRKLLKESDK